MAAKPTSKPKPMARKKSTPVPMPKKDMTRGTPVPMPVKPSAKPKSLNDFLKQNKRPLSRNKKGILSSPDVIIKGYNDKKTLGRKKK
jgi:hypothetical protein